MLFNFGGEPGSANRGETEYLDSMCEHREMTRLAHQRLYDMIHSRGTEEVSENDEKHASASASFSRKQDAVKTCADPPTSHGKGISGMSLRYRQTRSTRASQE